MNTKTLKALKGSIKKWESIVSGKGEDQGASNCPLCRLFSINRNPSDMCIGCPVMEHTGETGCGDTPYDEWSQLETTRVFNEESKAAALAELNFLKSLLPN